MNRFLFPLLALFPLTQALALPSFEPLANATSVAGGTSYTIGGTLANQTNALLDGWASIGGNFPGPEPTIVAGNLSYPALPASTGNSVAFYSTNAMGARLDLHTNGASGVFYYSYILQLTDISAVPTTNNNNAFAGFADTAGGQPQQLGRMGTRVLTKQSGGGYMLGLGRNNTAADYVYETTNHNVGDVLFIVGSYEQVAGVITNVNLWINPDTNTFGAASAPAPTLSAPNFTTTTGALNNNGVRAFVINCQYATAPTGIIDELRVGRTWKYVTGGDSPDPITITVQPTPRTVVAGDKVAFAVSVGGTLPSYQWRSNGVPIPGATLPSYSLANVQTSYAANYSVIITNAVSSVTSAPAALTVSATAFRLYDTNLVALRIGEGSQALSLNGNSMFLDQFVSSGTYLNTVSIPDDGPSAMVAMGPNLAGTSITGNCISRSADGRFLVVGGWNTNLTYGANLHDSLSSVVPRGLAIMDTFSHYTLTVSNTDYSAYSQTYWRGGVTDNGSNFWGAANGSGGTYYFGYAAPAEAVQTTFGNVRSIAIFNGSIYCVSAVSGNNGVLKMDGMPLTGATANPTILFPGSTATSDLEVSPDGNLIYVADDRVAPNGGVQRWQFDGSTWTLAYTLSSGLPLGARYLTADFRGANPIIYAVTTDSDNNHIVAIVDTGAASTGTTIASAGANQNFRGIRFGPSENAVVARPTLFYRQEGSNLVLSWSGAFTLQSTTNIVSSYSDVAGASSPYTNNMLASPMLFFRLRN